VLNALTINLFKVKKNENKQIIEIKEEKEDSNLMNIITIGVEGMLCKNCKAQVETACSAVEGVKSAEASLENKNVTILFDGLVDVEQIKKNIVEAGYEVK
jgi:Cu+-exporting ATPase